MLAYVRACTCAGDTRVFRSSSRVFFKVVRVSRQLHGNFACHTHTCDVALHARVRVTRVCFACSRVFLKIVRVCRQLHGNFVHVRDTYVHELKMGRLTVHDRLRVITLFSRGYSISTIRKRLIEENISISLQGIYNLIEKFREKGTIVDLPHQRRRWKITQEMRRFIEQEMSKNDELTSRRVKTLLCEKWPDLHVSITTIQAYEERHGMGLH